MTAEFNEQTTDEELVRCAKDGDSAAYTLLLTRYKQTVKGIARDYFLSGADMEDLAEEGMIGVLDAVRSFDEKRGAKFSTFANLCVRRKILSFIRHMRAVKNAEGDEVAYIESQDLPDYQALADPVALYEEKETYRAILDCLTNLERLVLQDYLAGYSYEEIAAHSKKDAKAVDNTIQRIRKKVSALIKRQ